GDAKRLFVKNKTRRSNGIATDIHKRAPAPLWIISHVLRIAIEITKDADNGAQLSDHAFANQLARPQPLRVRLHHECLANSNAGALADRQETLRFSHAQAQGLLAQHVLPCFGGFDGPGYMEMI